MIFLFNTDTEKAHITCAVITYVKDFGFFSVLMFMAYLMFRFAKPPETRRITPKLCALN